MNSKVMNNELLKLLSHELYDQHQTLKPERPQQQHHAENNFPQRKDGNHLKVCRLAKHPNTPKGP